MEWGKKVQAIYRLRRKRIEQCCDNKGEVGELNLNVRKTFLIN